MKSLRVLIFHPVILPPRDYGGTERVVLWLAKALRDLGHTVGVVCLEGSQLPEGIIFESVNESQKNEIHYFRSKSNDWFKEHYDLIHFMAPPSPSFFEAFSFPTLTTIHGNGKEGENFPKNTVFLSENHAKRHGRKSFVYNGMDLSEVHFKTDKLNSVLFLSKTSWSVKNLKGAMKIIQKAKSHLMIAGGNRPYLLKLKALLFPKYFKWMGPVNGNKKTKVLSDALGLIFPILWDEPFGLVMIEALASGTPVFGPKRGSLPEIINEHCGFLYPVDSTIQEQVQYFKTYFENLSPSEIKKRAENARARVLELFTHHQMAKNYLKIYEKVLSGEKIE